MGSKYKQDGAVLEHENGSGSDIAVDDVVVLGGNDSVAVALVDIANTEKGSVAVEGVFELAKKTGSAWTQGELLDFDVDNSEFDVATAAGSGETRVSGVAYAAADAAASDTVGEVKLANPGAEDAG